MLVSKAARIDRVCQQGTAVGWKMSAVTRTASPVHASWDRWIVENLARGVSEAALVARMERQGLDPVECASRVRELRESPAFLPAVDILRSLEKERELLNVLGRLRARNDVSVATVEDLQPDDFYNEYVHENVPVVILGLSRNWPALRKWTPRYLAALYGDVEIDITADRSDDPYFEERFASHVRRCTLREFVDDIESGGETNDYYLVSKNCLLSRPELTPLLSDFTPPPGFVNRSMSASDASLWLGPGGTVTPLHHDACNILFTQVHGRKRVHLIAPLYLPRLYNTRTCFTSFDPEHPDFDRFPETKGLPLLTVELGPGDTLFIPVGWWHHVRALSPSISLSFTRFELPREAHVWAWRHEGDRRYE